MHREPLLDSAHPSATATVTVRSDYVCHNKPEESLHSRNPKDWDADDVLRHADEMHMINHYSSLADEEYERNYEHVEDHSLVKEQKVSPAFRNISVDKQFYYTDSENTIGSGHSNASNTLTAGMTRAQELYANREKMMENIGTVFQKHADGSFLTEKGFVRSLQTLEPSLYFSECSTLFDIYDDQAYGYVPFDAVVNDLAELEVDGAIQAPILHFLSMKIMEHTLGEDDLSSAFHFLVQSVREIEILQRERAAWDEEKIRTMLFSASLKRGKSSDKMTMLNIAFENLQTFQLDYQARTAHMLAQVRMRKEKFEITLGDIEAWENSEDPGGETLQEIRDMKRFSQNLYRNIDLYEEKLLLYEADMKDLAIHVMEEQNGHWQQSVPFDGPRFEAPARTTSPESDASNVAVQSDPVISVDQSEFDQLLEKRKGLLDAIHDALRSLVEEAKYELIMSNFSDETIKYTTRSSIGQIWTLSMFMAHLLRLFSIAFWVCLVLAYFDYIGRDMDISAAQFWVFSGPIFILLLHQIYKFFYQICFVHTGPHDYTSLIFRPIQVGHFTIDMTTYCISPFTAETCCEHFILGLILTLIYCITIPFLFLHDLTS